MAVGEKVTISGLQGPFAAIRPSGLVQQQGHTFLALQVGVVTLTNRSEFCYSYIPKVVHHPICPLLQIDIVASANDIEGASVMPNLLGMAYTQASSNLQDRFGQQLHVHLVRVHTPTRYPVGDVVAQSPAADTSVTPATKIVIKIAEATPSTSARP